MPHDFRDYLPRTIAITDYIGEKETLPLHCIDDILNHGYTDSTYAWEMDTQIIILDDLYDGLIMMCDEDAELDFEDLNWDRQLAAEYLYDHIDQEPLECILEQSSPVAVFTPCTKQMLHANTDLYDLAHDILPTTAPFDYQFYLISTMTDLSDCIKVPEDTEDPNLFMLHKPMLVARHHHAAITDPINHSAAYLSDIAVTKLVTASDKNALSHHAHGTVYRTR